MKAYTDINQSKKLAEILPLESADMYWLNRHIDLTETKYEVFVIDKSNKYIDFFNSYAVAIDNNEIIPCWSLAALLGILANETHNIDDDGYIILSSYKGNWWNISPINCISEEIKESNNPLDAAFEMVVRLKQNGKI